MALRYQNYINKLLLPIAENIEKEVAEIHVISGQLFRFPYLIKKVNILKTEPKPFNIVEEFILRGAKELNPPLTLEQFASVLGLEELFIRTISRELEILGQLVISENNELLITEEGKINYEKGYHSQEPKEIELDLAYLPITEEFIVLKDERHSELNYDQEYLPGFSEFFYEHERSYFLEDMNVQLKESTIIDSLNSAGLFWHRPVEGKTIKWLHNEDEEPEPLLAYQNIYKESINDYSCGVLVLDITSQNLDKSQQNLSLQAYNFLNNKRDILLENLIINKIEDKEINIDQYFSERYKSKILALIERYRNDNQPLIAEVISDIPEVEKEDEKPITKDIALKPYRLVIKENETGHSFNSIFGPYVKDATEISITDRYIRKDYQIKNFISFLNIIDTTKHLVKVRLKTGADNYEQGAENKLRFKEIKKRFSKRNLELSFTILTVLGHPRIIEMNNGWIIDLDSGFDIFQKPDKKYDYNEDDQTKLKCKKSVINFSRMT